jgi:type IV secretory pathway protease TraF
VVGACGVARHTVRGLAARGLGHLDAAARDTAPPIAACVHTGHPVRDAPMSRGVRSVSTMRGLAAVLCVIIPLSLLAVSLTSVRFNISHSLPLGLYRLHPLARPLTPGTLAVVDVPGWSARTVPFLKPVAAVAGEWVCRVGDALVIHGEDYGPVYEAWRGDPLPSAIAADTCARVPPRHVFLATAAPSSLDSRYYGPVAVAQISAIATPLWIWETADAAPRP